MNTFKHSIRGIFDRYEKDELLKAFFQEVEKHSNANLELFKYLDKVVNLEFRNPEILILDGYRELEAVKMMENYSGLSSLIVNKYDSEPIGRVRNPIMGRELTQIVDLNVMVRARYISVIFVRLDVPEEVKNFLIEEHNVQLLHEIRKNDANKSKYESWVKRDLITDAPHKFRNYPGFGLKNYNPNILPAKISNWLNTSNRQVIETDPNDPFYICTAGGDNGSATELYKAEYVTRSLIVNPLNKTVERIPCKREEVSLTAMDKKSYRNKVISLWGMNETFIPIGVEENGRVQIKQPIRNERESKVGMTF